MNSQQLSIFDMPVQNEVSKKEITQKVSAVPTPTVTKTSVVNEVDDVRTVKQVNNKVSYDVGEKIGGARKDLEVQKQAFLNHPSVLLWKELEGRSATVAAEVMVRKTFFSWFSFEDCKERGVEPHVAKALELLINRIPKSSKDTPEDREKYMTTMTFLSDILKTVVTLKDFYNFETRIIEFFTPVSMMQRFEEDFIAKEKEYQEAEDTVVKAKLELEMQMILARLHMIELGKTMALRAYGGPFLNYFITPSSRKSTLRNAFKVKSYDALIPNNNSEKTRQPGRKKRAPVWERELPENPVRIGGKDIAITKPEDFVSHFGFRASEFGHYVEDETGSQHLLRSAEAYTDLADILNIPVRAVSLKGELAMAFGSRGRGNALGHYEPARKVINLTKRRGSLGILAHEWFHALDHFLYNKSYGFENGKIGFLTDNNFGDMPDGIQVAVDELLEAIKVGESAAYIDVTNRKTRYKVNQWFIELYDLVSGDLKAFMNLAMNNIDKQHASLLNGIVSKSHYARQKVKYDRRRSREMKKIAEVLAEHHLKKTGEEVESIPYTSGRSEYYQHAISMDRTNVGRYWSSDTELTARAFESYIQSKLKERGWTSDYLVCGIRDSVFPQGEERNHVHAAMGNLLAAVHPILMESVEMTKK